MRLMLWCVFMLAAGPACSDDDGDGEEPGDHLPDFGSGHEPGQILSDSVTICDGSDDLRMAALLGQGGNTSPAASVVDGNGSRFVYVDGRCRYWVTGVSGQALTGTLDPAEADLLTSRLGVGAWPEFQGQEWSGDWYDAPSLVLWTPSGAVHCSRQCQGASLPEPLSLIADALQVETERLAAGAQPLDGPMRAYGLTGARPGDHPTLEWTYEPAVADFCYSDENGNVGVDPALVVDPAAAAALRTAWLDSQEGGGFYLTVSDEAGALYRVFARDVLPFEPDDPWGVDLP